MLRLFFTLAFLCDCSDEGQIKADYDVSFEAVQVYSKPESVTNYITQTVAPKLRESGVGNYSVSTDSMVQAVNNAEKKISKLHVILE